MTKVNVKYYFLKGIVIIAFTMTLSLPIVSLVFNTTLDNSVFIASLITIIGFSILLFCLIEITTNILQKLEIIPIPNKENEKRDIT